MKIKEDNKKNYLDQQGITLIALVVTIVVLLILAAVTISAVFGENGLLKSIEIAREKTKIAEYKEDLNQKLLEAKINVLVDDSKVLEETRKIILRDEKYDGAVVSEVKDNKFTVITKEGYKFEVTPDGAEYIEKTSGTIEGNKGSIVMTAAVEGAKADITFELKGKKDIEQWATEWLEKYTADKTEADLEADVVKAYNKNNNTTYENFDDLLTAEGKTRDDLKKTAENDGISYKSLLFIQGGGEGAFLELYFTYILDLSGIETDYNKQLEIINDTDKLKEKVVQILECNSFEELLAEHNLTEESLEQEMQESNLTYNQILYLLAVEFYQPITVNVSNGDSFKVDFTDIMDSKPYKYTSSEVGTLTFVATGPQGMTGSIDIEFTAAKVKLTVKHIDKSGAELKATTETEYDKDTAVTVKSETISGYKTYSAKITATEVNETLTEGAPVELSFGIYMDTEVVITYDVLQSGETEKEYEEKPTISEVTNTSGEKTAIKVSSVAKDSSIKESLPTDIKNSDNSYIVDIEPVKSNSGPLTITLDVSNKAEDGDTANVRHYKNSVWDNLGDFIVAQGKITFTIDSFSPFCITIKKKGSSTGGNTTGGNDNPSTTTKISTLVGTVVDKNTKAEDAYGNKITIPKGFKVVAHGTVAGSATYTYSGDNIPAVQDGIVIENGTDGNQFVWVPVGTIKNKNGSTNTITLGRYSNFKMTNGAVASGQPVQVASVENCTQTVTINDDFQELSTSREGYSAPDPTTGDSTAQNATARNLEEFISTTLAKGGYYIAGFEASGTTSKVTSKYNQTVLTNITQPNAAKLAREMYGEVNENNELIYASDLVNSYAWDTAIIFIQTYSTGEDASSYASKNKSTSFANSGINNDRYCNIWDMSGNAYEWTTEYSTYSNHSDFYPCVYRGGFYHTAFGGANDYTSSHRYSNTTNSGSILGLRPLLYVK